MKQRACLLAFTVAFATLAEQILFYRIISAKFLNNYAFLVVSLTMLGFACSGVILTRYLTPWLKRLDEMSILLSSLFVISSILVTAVFYHSGGASLDFKTKSEFILTLLKTLPYALLFAIPFTFSGLLLGLLLSAPDLPTQRVYCWDLIGSACGATAILPAVSMWGVENSLLLVTALSLGVATLAAKSVKKSVYLVSAITAGLIFTAYLLRDRVFELRYPAGSMLAATYNPKSGWAIEHIAWDPVARIEVSRIPPPHPATQGFPCLLGSNLEFLSHFEKVLTQNNFAFTYAVNYDGRPDSLKGIEQTIYAAAYIPQTTSNPKVAVIGVGGGFDILTALNFQAKEVTGIEVNRATLDILRVDYADYFKAWVNDPRVRLVHDEGRHFLAGAQLPFDIIQLSGVDSYSGTPGAAHVFSENYLYTLEAFGMYFSRLSPNGVLNVMRLEHQPPCEMLRALTTAVAALRAGGVERPAQHIAMLAARKRNFAALLVKKSPFTSEEVARLSTWADANTYTELIAAPGWTPPVKNHYHSFLALGSVEDERAVEEMWPLNIQPTTDNLPFFFNFSRWEHLTSKLSAIQSSVPVMELTLITLFVLVSIAVFVCVKLPLRGLRSANPPWRHGVIFAGTALAYLAIEIALLQKFGLFLGHPNYALSVVLAGLLAATGVGSVLSQQILERSRGARMLAYGLVVLVLLYIGVVFPILHKIHIDSFVARVTIVLLLLAPLGILMGTFVPTALDRMKATMPTFVPWAWGISGVFSVLAPIVSIAFSMTWGIDALLLCALPIYLIVGWAHPQAKA